MRKSSGLLVLFLSVLLFVAAFLTATTEEAGAEPMLLGTTGVGEGPASTLVELNPATGALIRTIGSVGYIVNGLVYDHTTGRLFASTSVTDPSYNGLIEISLATGAGTPVGVNGWGLGSAAVTNITVNAAGQMYGWWDPSQDDLVIIDKTTGIATWVGNAGVGTGANGLDFDSSDILYMLNYNGNYYTVNTSTGALAFVNSIPSMAHHGKFHPDSNIWYGIHNIGTGPKNLVLANLSTGTIVSTIPTVDNLHTLEFVSQIPSPPPVTCAHTMNIPTSPANIGTFTPGIFMNYDPMVARPFGLEEAGDILTGRLWLPCLRNGHADIYLVLDAPAYGGKFMLSELHQWLSFPANIQPWQTNTDDDVYTALFSLQKSGILPGNYKLDVIVVPSGTAASTIDQIVSGAAAAPYYKWSFTETLP
ncbi:MAG: hypothetical protein AB1306_05910 [Nitrospirota bacterium]